MKTTREAIDDTIENLRALIEQAVRAEQLRHQLTGLPNASALDEQVVGAIEDGQRFWLAFLEIDQFKRVNDRFGYDRADALLREVASSLGQAAPRYFADQARAFHAHGDEFYILGRSAPIRFTADDVEKRLNTIRESVAQISLSATEVKDLMKCTVSVGWIESGEGTSREYMHRLEIAVAHAKRRGRNQVVMFDESMRKSQSTSLRSDCAECQTVFSLDVPLDDHRDDPIFCPNCGTRSARPHHAMRAPGSKDITDVPAP